MSAARKRKNREKHLENAETDLVRFLPIDEVRPSPENDRIYRPIDPSAPDILALARSVAEHGVKEPLVVTLDVYILSGHRRHCAAKLAGLTTVPCRLEPIRRVDDIDRFVQLLREYNRQREKSLDEKVREEVISANPEEAYQSLISHRREKARVDVETLEIVGTKHRAEITAAKKPMLDAVLRILEEQRVYWPLSDRRIHYGLLNDPPLIHARKRRRYANTIQCYKNLVDLLTRGRIAGLIAWEAIADDTRPVFTWKVWRGVGDFVRQEVAEFLKGYWRDLMQSQPNHIEIIGEKSTLAGTIKPVAMEYCIPLTLGRGYCSLPPRRDMFLRFQKSGKEKLIPLVLSDFDPEGEDIAHSFVRSMRDDFGVRDIVPIKVALKAEHVSQFSLPPIMQAKEGSSRRKGFVAKHGQNVWELEALTPEQLQQLLRDAIDSVLDIAAFNAELAAEKQNAAELDVIRRRLLDYIRDIMPDGSFGETV